MNIVKAIIKSSIGKIIDQPWYKSNYEELFRRSNLRLSNERAFTMLEFAKKCISLDGDWIEMGVYKGSTSLLLAEMLFTYKSNKKLMLFDTFMGTPKSGINDNIERMGQYKKSRTNLIR